MPGALVSCHLPWSSGREQPSPSGSTFFAGGVLDQRLRQHWTPTIASGASRAAIYLVGRARTLVLIYEGCFCLAETWPFRKFTA
jgi:hypothetical protein